MKAWVSRGTAAILVLAAGGLGYWAGSTTLSPPPVVEAVADQTVTR